MRWRTATAILTAPLLAACSDSTAPDRASGIFVLTRIGNQSVPLVSENDYGRFTLVADTIYLYAGGSAEQATVRKVESPYHADSSAHTWRSARTYKLHRRGFALLPDPAIEAYCICVYSEDYAHFIEDGFVLTRKWSSGETHYDNYRRVQ